MERAFLDYRLGSVNVFAGDLIFYAVHPGGGVVEHVGPF